MVAERVSWAAVRKIGARLTTPLHPDDYLSLINPLWTARGVAWLIALVVPMVLLVQAGVTQRRAQEKVFIALTTGLVKSPTLTFLDGWSDHAKGLPV